MTDIKTELHILNGDFALGIWRQCGFTGQSLVWRETYLEGPLPETEDLRVSGLQGRNICRILSN